MGKDQYCWMCLSWGLIDILIPGIVSGRENTDLLYWQTLYCIDGCVLGALRGSFSYSDIMCVCVCVREIKQYSSALIL